MSNIWSKSLVLIFVSSVIGYSWHQSNSTSDSHISDADIDFNFHVRPILSDKCLNCHGPDAQSRKGDFRLDQQSFAFSVLSSGHYAIVPGSSKRSMLIERIKSKDPSLVMPPPDSKLKLTTQEIEILSKWIDAGANWKDHWSFIPPAISPLSDDKLRQDVSEIDYFIEQQLTERGLTISEKADPESLLKRVTQDITGLPPDKQLRLQFASDNSDQSYEQIVDHLLESDAYGERMAAEWMDVARYADTHGYLDDTHREVWHWRDWVIEAFNDNLPYDEFITWQLAGDLLKNASKKQQIASGFNRLHRQNQEGGIVPEEYRVEAVADRVHTTATAFLGLTMECARCHDHKYDPFTQKNFYEMAAFFDNTDESGRAPIGYESGPTMLLTDSITDSKLDSLKIVIKRLEGEDRLELENLKTKFQQWRTDGSVNINIENSLSYGLRGHFGFEEFDGTNFINSVQDGASAGTKDWSVNNFADGVVGKSVLFDEKNAIFFGNEIAKFERTDPFSFSMWVKTNEPYQDASILDNADHKWHAYRGYEVRIEHGRPLFRISHNYPQNCIEIVGSNLLPVDEWFHMAVTYDGSSRAEGMRIFINGSLSERNITHDNLYKSILHDASNEMVVMPYLGLKVGWRMNDPTLLGGQIDEFRIYDRILTPLEISHIATGGDPTISFDEDELFEWYSTTVEERKVPKTSKAIREIENEILTAIPEVMTMGEQRRFRKTHILNRGMYDEPLEVVSPNLPEFILPFNGHFEPNRLGLASWITDPNNPLTARVAVNRIWQMLFGSGLVNTPEDFGSQGGLPSHPELLDWLAVTFIESGWDVKSMIKMIVLTDTYKQSSFTTEQHESLDPENKWRSRGPIIRLSAEMIRDQALASSGLLNRQIGGASFKPYQPDGLWSELAFQAWAKYKEDEDENLYRRSLYIYWKQNTPHPYLTTFDVADRGSCAVQRTTTSSPNQALMLLNYPQFIESARSLAYNAMLEHETNEGRLRNIFESLISKRPTHSDMNRMKSLYQSERERFANDQAALDEYLMVGLFTNEKKVDNTSLAALSVVGHTLMNTTSYYMKS